MSTSIVAPRRIQFIYQVSARLCPGLVSALLLGVFPGAIFLRAQQIDASQNLNPETAQVLMQRIDQLEARLKEVEAALAKSQASNPSITTANMMSQNPGQPVPPPQEPEHPAEPVQAPEHQADAAAAHTEGEPMDLNKTLLQIRGFADTDLTGSTMKGFHTSFSLGQVNLFITSDLSDKLKFLSEVVFEAGPDNVFGVDIERLLLTYRFNRYFNLAVGRYHTSIGYYNTAYHHSTWLQTTVGRPFLFRFEDQGGILPIHNVGASLSGRIPSGRLGLHYIAEVGNGRATSSPQSEPVQNEVDENTHKAFNFQVFARPEALPGLQTGFSVYRDLLTPIGLPSVNQTILDYYFVYKGHNYEWLNEALLVREAPRGSSPSPTVNIPGFYTQISKRFGAFTPYFRYQYVNAPLNGPVFYTNVGLQYGPSVGLRYDLSDFVAWKLQYDYNSLKNGQSVQTVTLQACFTF
jgi:hypothetical protein